MIRLCKTCGNAVEIHYENEKIFCSHCNEELEINETISEHCFSTRVQQLKAMHELMCNANDEYIYMTWIITGVPDEPSDADFEDIALDDELYNECFDLFVELIQSDGNRW